MKKVKNDFDYINKATITQEKRGELQFIVTF